MRPSLLNPLFASVQTLPGVGPKLEKLYRRLLGRDDGARALDLLFHLPTGLIDRRARPKLADVVAGTVVTVKQHDGSILRLRKLAEDYDATDRIKVMNYLQERAAEGEVVTGLLYVNPDSQDLHENMETTSAPLNTFGARDLCPGNVMLEKINASMR